MKGKHGWLLSTSCGCNYWSTRHKACPRLRLQDLRFQAWYIRFHQTADVDIKKENIKDAQYLCYNEGVVFICERDSSAILFVDLQNTVQTNVNSLKRDALISHLEHFGLKPNGTVPVLREVLKRQLKSIADSVEHVDHVQVNPPLSQPSAIRAAGKGILLCADDDTRYFFPSDS